MKLVVRPQEFDVVVLPDTFKAISSLIYVPV
jgi:isocitrate/isopropylmalate dehydrogenase